MDNEKNQELDSRLEGSTFVEKGEISVEAVSQGPEVSFEEKNIESETKIRKDLNKDKKQSTGIIQEEGLGYSINDEDEINTETFDSSSSNTWRRALKDKKIA